jgi:rRNA maturation endonuclease Nob1
MISISLTWFVFLYLMLSLAGVLLLWIGYEMLRKRHANAMSRVRVYCRICGTRYTDTSTEEILVCPVCGSRNERSNGMNG